MKPTTATIYVECSIHGGESAVDVEHDHGGSYGCRSEELWSAKVNWCGCECSDSDIEERAIAQMEDEC